MQLEELQEALRVTEREEEEQKVNDQHWRFLLQYERMSPNEASEKNGKNTHIVSEKWWMLVHDWWKIR